MSDSPTILKKFLEVFSTCWLSLLHSPVHLIPAGTGLRDTQSQVISCSTQSLSFLKHSCTWDRNQGQSVGTIWTSTHRLSWGPRAQLQRLRLQPPQNPVKLRLRTWTSAAETRARRRRWPVSRSWSSGCQVRAKLRSADFCRMELTRWGFQQSNNLKPNQTTEDEFERRVKATSAEPSGDAGELLRVTCKTQPLWGIGVQQAAEHMMHLKKETLVKHIIPCLFMCWPVLYCRCF